MTYVRTNVVLDQELVEQVMRRYRFRTKREAIDYCASGSAVGYDPAEILALAGTRLELHWERTGTTALGRTMGRVVVLTRGAPFLWLFRRGLKTLERAERRLYGPGAVLLARVLPAARRRYRFAVPAIRADATLLHADRDFETLARHTPLRLEPV